jgi:hypothetical protein
LRRHRRHQRRRLWSIAVVAVWVVAGLLRHELSGAEPDDVVKVFRIRVRLKSISWISYVRYLRTKFLGYIFSAFVKIIQSFSVPFKHVILVFHSVRFMKEVLHAFLWSTLVRKLFLGRNGDSNRIDTWSKSPSNPSFFRAPLGPSSASSSAEVSFNGNELSPNLNDDSSAKRNVSFFCLAFISTQLQGCPGWGANPGSFWYHLFSHSTT